MPHLLIDALQKNLGDGIAERIRRLGDFIQRQEGATDDGIEGEGGEAVFHGWRRSLDAMRSEIAYSGEPVLRDRFLETVMRCRQETDGDYLAVISALPPAARETGTAWLEEIVSHVQNAALAHLTSLSTRESGE
jgi:hypothetical protein